MGDSVANIIYAVIVSTILLIIASPVLLALVLGVPASPVAALYCAIKARQRGWNVGRYALAGAISSALFFWPCVYLIFRINGKKVSLVFVRLFFILIFFIWMLGPVLSFLLFGTIGFLFERDSMNGTIVSSMYLFIGIVNLALWIIARKSLPDLPGIYDGPNEDIIPDRRYVAPLIYAFFGTAMAGVAMYGRGFFGL